MLALNKKIFAFYNCDVQRIHNQQFSKKNNFSLLNLGLLSFYAIKEYLMIMMFNMVVKVVLTTMRSCRM